MSLRRSSDRFLCRSCTRKFGHQRRRQFASLTALSSASTSSSSVYDVVCVGGGPAGLSLLTALRANPVTAGLRLALIEAQDLSRIRSYAPTPDQFANRCSSLTPSSVRFLDQIGAWAHLRRERVQSYQGMKVWDGVTGASINFDLPPGMMQRTDMGSTIAYMVENNNLTAGLLRRLEELGGVDVFESACVGSIDYGTSGGAESEGPNFSQWPAVQLAGPARGTTLLARLLVGADGANSPVRAFSDIPTRGWDYERHGVVATMLLEEGTDSPSCNAHRVAYQRFLPTGPVALLPLPGHYATLVWSTTPERAAILKSLAPADFVSMVNAAFRLRPVDLTFLHGMSGGFQDDIRWRLSSEDPARSAPSLMVGVQPHSVASFPLKLRHADTYIAERVALIGDAAHTVHPLAGQGLNLGQGDVESLSKTIAYAVQHGQDLGVRTSLESYPAERYIANHVLMGVCDKLHKLYAVESGPLVPLRSLGLRAVDVFRPLKNLLMSQAADSGRGI
ncbi:Putative ubiquinone biosynthesis monooxygenase [Sporothrix epigloea]|uniref:Ubiquinone biosynthesis monooxygenase COQ6, mitochondrial n=1 Tax=Sporothrix epigloea TaxID=1892477 RepID=A0ABP0E272_9PEZI